MAHLEHGDGQISVLIAHRKRAFPLTVALVSFAVGAGATVYGLTRGEREVPGAMLVLAVGFGLVMLRRALARGEALIIEPRGLSHPSLGAEPLPWSRIARADVQQVVPGPAMMEEPWLVVISSVSNTLLTHRIPLKPLDVRTSDVAAALSTYLRGARGEGRAAAGPPQAM